jgi:hypothetical protein
MTDDLDTLKAEIISILKKREKLNEQISRKTGKKRDELKADLKKLNDKYIELNLKFNKSQDVAE